MKEKIEEMLNFQKMLDNSIESEYGLEYGKDAKYNLEGLKRALFDELGELNHEDKKSWCWWKKTQHEVDRNKLLEELVDCFHFSLSIAYHESQHYKFNEDVANLIKEDKMTNLMNFIQSILILKKK